VYYFVQVIQVQGKRAQLGRIRPLRPSSLGVATIVCLILLAFLTVVQVAHVHPIGADTEHCPLCIAIHSVVPLLVMVTALLLVKIGTAAPVLLEVRTILRYWHPTLFTRPPPR
jgi:hypothetical protein